MTASKKRVLIVDDEAPARAQLLSVIEGMAELTVVAEEGDGRAAIVAISEHRPDIVFLDIDMPEVDGFEVARATEHLMYQLVFLTAHHQHALQAFETHAIDYLLKPARPSVIEKCLAKVLRQEVLTLQKSPAEDPSSGLVLTDSGTSHLVERDHVVYIEGLGRYRRIHLSKDGVSAHRLETLLSDTTLDEFTAQLGEQAFLRVHRSYLVNASQVTSLKQRGRGNELFLAGVGSPIPVARSRLGAIKSALGIGG
ncbi:MAG: LytTR family DNA-binding domain-containing protein [Pseudomonadota bacterium]